MQFEWPYYTLHNGRLYNENGRPTNAMSLGTPSIPTFKSSAEAEQWLINNDVRGNVRP